MRRLSHSTVCITLVLLSLIVLAAGSKVLQRGQSLSRFFELSLGHCAHVRLSQVMHRAGKLQAECLEGLKISPV